MSDILLHDDFEQMQKIASEIARGENPTSIAKKFGMKRGAVVSLYDQWKQVATNDEVVRERSRAVLAEADNHYDQITKEYWNVVEEADQMGGEAGLKIKNAALKNVADITAKRVEFLARAGLMEDATLADQIAEAEEKMEQIKTLLKEVVSLYPHTKSFILEGLGRIFNRRGHAEGVVVSEVITPGE
jgi:regulator of RNase E activity RraB